MKLFVFVVLLIGAGAAGFHFYEEHNTKMRDWNSEVTNSAAQVLIPIVEEGERQKQTQGRGMPQRNDALIGNLSESAAKLVSLLEHKPGWFRSEAARLTEEEEKILRQTKLALVFLDAAKKSRPLPSEVTLMDPVQIRLANGAVTLPAGTKVRVLGRDGAGLRIQYLGNSAIVPEKSTNLAR